MSPEENKLPPDLNFGLRLQSKMVEEALSKNMTLDAIQSKIVAISASILTRQTKAKRLLVRTNEILTLFNYITYWLIGLVLGKKWRKNQLATLLQVHFQNYFTLRGVLPYNTVTIPKKPERPMIILTTKTDEMNALFSYTRFPFPILIPYPQHTKQLQWIKHIYELVSYPNISLNTTWPHLKKLVEDGYSVLIEINPEVHEPLLKNSVPIYDIVKKIVSDKNLPGDLYFLHTENFDLFPTASQENAIQVRVDLKKPEEIYTYWTEASLEEKLYRMHTFFHIWEPIWVVPKPLKPS